MPLQLLEIRKCYAEVAAVDGVSLTVADGEFFALLGPSGCGKTTLLRIIAGIVAPDAGSVRLDGRTITDAPLHGRNITLVFQSYALFPHRTVHENIAFGLVMRRESKAAIRDKVERALQLVRLGGLGDRYPAQISGGQQQRVALARALVVSPKVLLLDEPLSNLDARLRDEMRDELKEIQRQVGITTVLVTHDIQEAFVLSDRIAVLNGGRIEQIGTPADIYRTPRSRFVAQFAGQVNIFHGRLESIVSQHVTVELAGGQRIIGHRGADDLRPGATVSLYVRPEALVLSSTGSGLAASVQRTTYLGNATRLHLDAGGERVLADIPGGGHTVFGAGARLVIDWRPEDAVVLPAEGRPS
jgi:putative spermidine/putrescine transport system ATP-binding protein